MPAPSLTRHEPAGVPTGVVLMLHGGKAHGRTPVDDRSASWRRARWMMGQIGGALDRAGHAVWLLRYGVRGWNAPAASPVADVRWALEEVRRAHGDVPVVLLGHSMGARAGVAAADDPSVTGVVALAPWLPADEPVRTLAGKHLAAAHGRTDKITSARQTRAFVRRAEQVAASAEFHDMGAVGHYMLRHVADWNRFARDRALALLAGGVARD